MASSFALNTKNLIGNKMRQEMYLKHLREVQKINNRDADGLKKELKCFRSISELHRSNKDKANRTRLEEINRSIEEKNGKILEKIRNMGSDEALRQAGQTLLATMSTVNNKNIALNRTEDGQEPPFKSPAKNEHVKTLHYRYRKRQQDQILEQNTKIFKAIETQKSMLLPLIGKTRCVNQLNRSHHRNRKLEVQTDIGSPETEQKNDPMQKLEI